MSSSDKENKNELDGDDGSIQRVRTQSECSATSDNGSGRRERTISQQYMVASGLVAASPPKFVSLEEIMKAAKGIRDMALVHQIAVEDNFRLERAELEANTIQKVLKDTMHRAFWDILREQLSEDPPNFTQALVLFENIKEGLFGVLLPQHLKIKQQISEVLDTVLIKQQVDNGSLDFKHYAEYVISVMSKLCAPVRDENIAKLTQTVDVVETFKGILEMLDLMALDMANFTLELARPDIIQQSVELERSKFADYLAIQPDGLQYTRQWLLRHFNPDDIAAQSNVDEETRIRNLAQKTFYKACIELLEWNRKNLYPETFMLDEKRLTSLEVLTNQTVLMGTILLVTGSCVSPDLQSIAAFKETIKEHAIILLQSISSENELKDVLVSIAIQILLDIKETQKAHGLIELTEEAEALLKQQIIDIEKPNHRIRELVRQRVKEFLLQIIESSTAAPQKVPTGLTSLQKELATIAGQFLKIVSHNSTVFGSYYVDIIKAALPNNS